MIISKSVQPFSTSGGGQTDGMSGEEISVKAKVVINFGFVQVLVI